MKMEVANVAVERDGTQGGGKFTIKASAKAFQILTGSLYSDKILAIVRELSCNAYDAHVACGKQATPIEIQLPSTLNPTFYVKDFGVGLDDHQVRGRWIKDDEGHDVFEHGIYTTFFDSSKTTSNDFIGALGLGSKSPFSYTKSFIVSSRFNGIVRSYTMFLNENGEPEVQLMAEQPTSEPNGVTVEIAVKRDDIYKFHDAASKALMYFNPAAVVKGSTTFKPYKISHTFAGSTWKLRESESASGFRGPRVVQGFVSYPIDVGQLGDSNFALKLVGEVNVDIYVPIGSVDIAPSREHLSYDNTTIENLRTALTTVAMEIRDVFQKQIDAKCTTMWQAIQHHLAMQTGAHVGVYNTIHRSKPFVFNGQPIDHEARIAVDDIDTVEIWTAYNGSKKLTLVKKSIQKRHSGAVVTEGLSRGQHVFIADIGKGTHTLIKHLIENSTAQCNYAIVIRPNVMAKGNAALQAAQQADIDKIVERLGDCPVTRLSDHTDLLKQLVVTTAYKAKPKDQFNFWKGFLTDDRGDIRYKFSAKCWDTDQIDVSQGGYYVPVDRHSVVVKLGSERDVEYFDKVMYAARKLNIIGAKDRVYGMTEKRFNALDDTDKTQWTNVFDLMAQFMKAPATIDAWSKDRLIATMYQQVYGSRALYEMLASEAYRIADVDFKHALLAITDITTKKTTPGYDEINMLSKLPWLVGDTYKNAVDPGVACSALDSAFQAERDRFPMLTMISWSSADYEKVRHIIGYINTVHKASTI